MQIRLRSLNAALALPAAVSLFTGLRNALAPSRGQDLQWSGAHLVLQHTDPYRQYLLHDPHRLILFSQVPNYLQELYVLLLPLTALSFPHAKVVWAILNFIFITLILFLLRRLYTLDAGRTLLLALLLCASTPFRIVLGSGQQTFLELLFFVAVFALSGPSARGVALGLSYFKYSFSPVLVFYLFFCGRLRLLLLSLLPPLAGLLGMWSLVGGNLLHLAVEPLLVSRTGVQPGVGNLMSLLHRALDTHFASHTVTTIAYAAALLAGLAYAALLARRSLPTPLLLAALATASLAFFTHLSYDSVFLLPLLARCLAGPLNRSRTFILASIAWIWYGLKLLPTLVFRIDAVVDLTTFVLLLAFLVLLLPRRAAPVSGHASLPA